ncbi:MAG: mucoidy inhibitor MuiA family protein [Deltaproteobacteria bacterium]|nr:mucoidy inhibitor MuiA family protein [Deltaproteobacteria bacterium]MBW2307853.1 mucoidy inhibitor MuiA family protein [Deltaproteobacteria bacterium]
MKRKHAKRVAVITLLMLALGSIRALRVNAVQETVEVHSRVAEVTVYPDRAIVTRTARMELKKGSSRIAFTGLPAVLIDNAVRVSGSGEILLRLFGTEVKRVFLKSEPVNRVVDIKTKIKELSNGEQSLKDREDVLIAREKFLDSIQIHAADQASRELKMQKMDSGVWEEAIRFIFADKESTRRATREAQRERREIAKEIERLRKELNQIQALRPLEKKIVFIDLEADAAGRAELSVSYMVHGARWTPLYEARFDPKKETLRLTQYGMVRQNTGEDWKDVVLFLSTAQPALGASAPKLRPWYLRIYSPPPVISRRGKVEAPAPSAMSRAMKAPMEEMKTGAPEMEAETKTADVFPQGTSMVFKVPKKENITGNGQSHKTTIAVKEFTPSLEYHTVPKLSAHAFLKATMTNSSGIPFLRGHVNVFSGPDYVGSTRLPLVAPDEKFEIQLGVDARIKVSRELVTHSRKEEGDFKKNRKHVYGYVIKLENYTSKTQTIYVQDQLPVSRDEKIKVERLALEPDPLPEKPEDQGILAWKVLLPPREKSEILIDFSIEFPPDIEVEGI